MSTLLTGEKMAWQSNPIRLPPNDYEFVTRKIAGMLNDGLVHLYRRKSDNKLVVAKIFDMSRWEKQEVKWHRVLCPHTGMANLIDIKDNFPKPGLQTVLTEFMYGKTMKEVLDYCGATNVILDREELYYWMSRLLKAIVWMGISGAASWHITMDNIVFDTDGVPLDLPPFPKIIDFGDTYFADTNPTAFTDTVHSFVQHFMQVLHRSATMANWSLAYNAGEDAFMVFLRYILSRPWSIFEVETELIPRAERLANGSQPLPGRVIEYFRNAREREDHVIGFE